MPALWAPQKLAAPVWVRSQLRLLINQWLNCSVACSERDVLVILCRGAGPKLKLFELSPWRPTTWENDWVEALMTLSMRGSHSYRARQPLISATFRQTQPENVRQFIHDCCSWI
jgi:hypothetical protein